jgi:hypothetical protein
MKIRETYYINEESIKNISRIGFKIRYNSEEKAYYIQATKNQFKILCLMALDEMKSYEHNFFKSSSKSIIGMLNHL